MKKKVEKKRGEKKKEGRKITIFYKHDMPKTSIISSK
jgi:hypothetical protein